MKKIASILLCLVMLLGCALAEGSAIRLDKLSVSAADTQLFALENLGLRAGEATSDEGGFGAHIDLVAGETALASAQARFNNSGLVLSLGDMLSHEYVISVEELMQLVSMSQQSTESAMPMPDLTGITEAFTALAGNTLASVQMVEGVYNDKDCKVSKISIAEADIKTLIEEICKLIDSTGAAANMGLGYNSLAEAYAAEPFDVGVEGKLYEMEDNSVAAVLDVNVTVNDEVSTFELIFNGEPINDGSELYRTNFDVKLDMVMGDYRQNAFEITGATSAYAGTVVGLDAQLLSAGQDLATLSYADASIDEEAVSSIVFDVNGLATIAVVWGEDGFDFNVSTNGQTVADISYVCATGEFNIGFDAGQAYNVSGLLSFEAEDGAWVNAPAMNPVSLLNMTQAQIEEITSEIEQALPGFAVKIVMAEPALVSLASSMLG